MKKRPFQFISAFGALLVFCNFLSVAVMAQSNPKTLKVMTYNIHHGNPPERPGVIDLPAIAAVIKQHTPDLVALQEIDKLTKRTGQVDQLKTLAELTGMFYFFSKGIDFEGGEYGVGILSRYPINSSNRYPLPSKAGLDAEARSLAVVQVTLPNGKPLNFASTHLDLNNEHRMLQVKEINRLLGSKKGDVILAGDLNLTSTTPAMKILEQHFTRSCTENCAPTIPQDVPTEEIDFILLKKGSRMKVISHQVFPNIDASDHLPVMAIYQLP
ncbi:endonuclease/exonuclease/phosphatase family protein [Pedobacter sp. PLR]|uniref:endonuclease/exonuclease/phosphatase family protein n=1 Tax=Pedobacter sp. PLR TaxID=2994465 RepID=UPI00224742E3|nr:endonuclease/exonuclease/phosphatase family protein [Pedobacter sp. PLR]MCX2453345.1 endonuclease/exonuclease/phosphatase family protein [Pedobacter sp. PLR]